MPGGGGFAVRLWDRVLVLCRRYAPRTTAVAVGVVVVLMGAVTVLRWFVDRAGQAAALLYVVPIALCALRFGRRGGVAAAGFGMAAFVTLELVHSQGDVDVTGWVAPLVAMALLGGLVGHLSESAAHHEAAHRQRARDLDAMREAHHAASEVNDSIVQQVAAARWMLEAGNDQEALAALDATVAGGIARVSGTLPQFTPGAARDALGSPSEGEPVRRDKEGGSGD